MEPAVQECNGNMGADEDQTDPIEERQVIVPHSHEIHHWINTQFRSIICLIVKILKWREILDTEIHSFHIIGGTRDKYCSLALICGLMQDCGIYDVQCTWDVAGFHLS